MKLTKLSKELEESFPEEIQKIRKFYFKEMAGDNPEESCKNVEKQGNNKRD